jgi:hypothetical protein
MGLNRTLAYFLGSIAFAFSLVACLHLQFLGFPDGSLTELERAEKILFNVFICISISFGVYSFYLGWIAAARGIGKRLCVTALLYTVFVVVAVFINYYFRLHLDSGAGG